jgi:hypothetical protein
MEDMKKPLREPAWPPYGSNFSSGTTDAIGVLVETHIPPHALVHSAPMIHDTRVVLDATGRLAGRLP